MREKRKRGRPRLLADEVKNIKYTIRLDVDLDERLQARVRKDKSSVSEVIRSALEEYLNQEK